MGAQLPCLLLLALTVFGGCLENDSAGFQPLERVDEDLILMWQSPNLVGPEQSNDNNPPPIMPRPPRPACDGANCHVQNFTIGDTGGRDVAISIEWEGQDESYDLGNGPAGYLGSANLALDLVILRDGVQITDGVESFHYAGVAILHDPEPGAYAAEVVARWGTGSYLGVVRIQDPNPGSDVQKHALGLPDLVMLPPDHLTFEQPLLAQASLALSAISPGCGPDEFVEDQELRCLRFAGILGNQGPGDLETRLQYDEAVRSTLGSGNWEQRIFLPEGEETITIGPAQYHAVHGHYHILDFVDTHLYAYDEETGTRGDELGTGRKTGFCIIDGGLIDPLAPAVPPKYHGNGCCYLAGLCQLDMATNPHFVMGMSAGWYDIYPWWRADQYVEVRGITDGTYELVSVINPDGLLREGNQANNEASTVFRLTGNTIEMLSQHTQADVGPHLDADWGYGA